VIISHIFTSASSERSIRRSSLIISTIRIESRFRLNSTARNKNFPIVCKNSKTIIWKFGSWTWWKSDVETCELDEKTDNQMRTWSKWRTWWKSVITWWKSADLNQSGLVQLSESVEIWLAFISLRHHLLCFSVFNYIDGTASIYGPSPIVINLMLPLPYIFTNIFINHVRWKDHLRELASRTELRAHTHINRLILRIILYTRHHRHTHIYI
jgi:hypothetical protein